MKAQAPKPVSNKQSLAVKDVKDEPTIYKDIDGNTVELSRYLVNNYIAPGSNFSSEQCWALINLSKARGLNPIAKDCYYIEYDGKPQVIVSKDYYMKRACKNPNYLGKENGIVVLNRKGEVEMRVGTIKLKDEELLGGWCKVYMKNLTYPIVVTASLDEYAKKKDGKFSATWASKTNVMIEKVAIVRALKEAMTEDFGGTYAAEEFGESEEDVASVSKDIPSEIKTESAKKAETEAVDAEFVDVDESTGEIVEEEAEEQSVDDMEFEAMQNSFFN